MKNIIWILLIAVLIAGGIAGYSMIDSNSSSEEIESPNTNSTTPIISNTQELESGRADTPLDSTNHRISFSDSLHGSAEYLAAVQTAGDDFESRAIQPIRMAIVDFDIGQFEQIKSLAMSSDGQLDNPLSIALFDDEVCSFSEYKTSQFKGASYMVDAKCEDDERNRAIRVSVDSSKQWASVRLVIGAKKIRLDPVSEIHAAVYEYREPSAEEKLRARQDTVAKRGHE